MFDEDDLLPLSLLQHVVFCPRRAALVHVERIWEENRFTAQGRILHERTHVPGTESRRDVRVTRALSIRSLQLGLSGKTDVVEFRRVSDSVNTGLREDQLPAGMPLLGTKGLWQPFPIEYKSGKRRHERTYEVQLCGQALCLEEMLGVAVPAGALFYGKTGRRLEMAFDEQLRKETREAATLLHRIVSSGVTPRAQYANKCKKCSLLSLCMPRVIGKKSNVRSYVEAVLKDIYKETR
jgi:CRISPR-associated exonuclease Cas4